MSSRMNSSAAVTLLKELRTSLEARAEETGRSDKDKATGAKSSVKSLGARPAAVKTVVKDFLTKNRATVDYASAVAMVDAAVARKVREEILATIEVLERFRREYEPSLFPHFEKWSAVSDDMELAEVLGQRVGAPLLAIDPSRMSVLKRWAKLRSVGKKRVAVLAACSLVTDGRRHSTPVLELCELLLHEDHPMLVGEIASLLRDTTRVDAKGVQDFLFRRSVDGNPDILRAGSENLDAARRAALIAKLEAQAATASGALTTAAGR